MCIRDSLYTWITNTSLNNTKNFRGRGRFDSHEPNLLLFGTIYFPTAPFPEFFCTETRCFWFYILLLQFLYFPGSPGAHPAFNRLSPSFDPAHFFINSWQAGIYLLIYLLIKFPVYCMLPPVWFKYIFFMNHTPQCFSVIPVSYTHLDVYKRQP